jgi:hypothetical protein
VEVHPRRRVVVLAPADRDAERQTTVREVVERRRLLGHERGVGPVGAMRMAVMSPIRSVTAAAAASAISGS